MLSELFDRVFNPWRERDGNRVVAAESAWNGPLKWNKQAVIECERCGASGPVEELASMVGLECNSRNTDGSPCGGEIVQHRPRVFCASLADVFEDWQGPMLDAKGDKIFVSSRGDMLSTSGVKSAPIKGDSPAAMQDVRDRLFRLIDATPNLDWLVLTKRPENIAKMMPPFNCRKDTNGDGNCSRNCEQLGHRIRPNLWLGTSIENQKSADERIPELLKIPAAVRFLSVEPLLSPIDLSKWIGYKPVHENQLSDGIAGLRYCACGRTGDRPRGPNLEGGEKGMESVAEKDGVPSLQKGPGGEQDRVGLPANQDDGKRGARTSRGSSDSLPTLQRADSRGADDQSQKRRKARQQSRESGVGDIQRAADSRDQNSQSGACVQSERREELEIETDGRSGSGHPSATIQGRIACQYCGGLPGYVPNDFQSLPWRPLGSSDLVIVGGESGSGARPCDIAWIRSIVEQCKAAGIACFVKQLGSNSVGIPCARCQGGNTPIMTDGNGKSVAVDCIRCNGTKTERYVLADKKGGDMAEWPVDLRIREFPIRGN